MLLTALDLAIIGACLAATVVLGLILQTAAVRAVDSPHSGLENPLRYRLDRSRPAGVLCFFGALRSAALRFACSLESRSIRFLVTVINQGSTIRTMAPKEDMALERERRPDTAGIIACV